MDERFYLSIIFKHHIYGIPLKTAVLPTWTLIASLMFIVNYLYKLSGMWYWLISLTSLVYSVGGLPTFKSRDACQKTSMEPLKGTNLGVTQVNFKPKEIHNYIDMTVMHMVSILIRVTST